MVCVTFITCLQSRSHLNQCMPELIGSTIKMADTTPESETFDELVATIQTAITMGVPPLATQAFSSGLINRPQLNACTHMMYTPDQQADMFLKNIGARIAGDPNALQSFRNILNMEAVYHHVVRKIGKPWLGAWR